MANHRVVIIGAGFGGLNTAKKLGGKAGVDVTIVDRRNHHLFQPLLYQVATAGLSPADIAAPIRGLLSKYENVSVLLGDVTQIDVTAKKVVLEKQTLEYDSLVVATGATHSYFNHPEWEEFAPGLKTLEQATEIRRRLLLAFELAEREQNLDRRRDLLSFVIVGGGATGVELAGAIAEISRKTLAQDFRRIDPSSTRVILIEAGDRLLGAFHPTLSKRAQHDLEEMGVQIWTNTRVTGITSEQVMLGAEIVKARTVFWAAGVKPSPLGAQLDGELKGGRVVVQPDLSLAQHPNVFVLGDLAYFEHEGKSLPGLAPVAMQQGKHAAANILKDVQQQPRTPYVYRDKGQMATVGRKKAVLESKGLRLSGFIAWAGWLFVHVFYLIGFKNRIVVLLQWAWSYFTFQRGARLIVDRDWRVPTTVQIEPSVGMTRTVL